MNTREIMISQLTNYERDNEIINELYEILGKDLDNFLHEIEVLYAQFNIDTVTWGIEAWEENMGIEPNVDGDLSDRRGAVKERMRKLGKVNTEMLEDVLQGYHEKTDADIKGDVEVWFNGRLMFNIPLEGMTPYDYKRINRTINTTKPAHLGYDINMYMRPRKTGVKLGTQTIDAAIVEIRPFYTSKICAISNTLCKIGNYNSEKLSVYPKHTYEVSLVDDLYFYIVNDTGVEEVGVYPKMKE